MKKITKFHIGTGLLYLAAQIILGFTFFLVFQWELVETFITSIVNRLIFLIIWIASLKVKLENNKVSKK